MYVVPEVEEKSSIEHGLLLTSQRKLSGALLLANNNDICEIQRLGSCLLVVKQVTDTDFLEVFLTGCTHGTSFQHENKESFLSSWIDVTPNKWRDRIKASHKAKRSFYA